MVKLFVMDVDGTLTDGKVYICADGNEAKVFDIKDGYGIAQILPRHGIVPVIMTGRSSKIVARRAKELKVDEVHQGVNDKEKILVQLMGKYKCTWKDVAYIGDDIPDLSCMVQCGVKGCPSNAAKEVLAVADYVCNLSGGQGAVREFIEWMICVS